MTTAHRAHSAVRNNSINGAEGHCRDDDAAMVVPPLSATQTLMASTAGLAGDLQISLRLSPQIVDLKEQ